MPLHRVVAVLFTIIPGLLFAQYLERAVTGSAGALIERAPFVLDFTIGEVAVSHRTMANSAITEGFHQAFLDTTAKPMVTERCVIDVYPNPFNRLTNLYYTVPSSALVVRVYDMRGVLIHASTLDPDTGTEEIDLHAYPDGIYVVEIIDVSEAQKFVQQIIKTTK